MLKPMLAIAAAVSMLLAAASANATVLQSKGGMGGVPFATVCPHGQYVVGFAARAGAWVDGVAPVCAPYLPAPGIFSGGQPATFHGGAGGAAQTQLCSSGTVVVRLMLGIINDDLTEKYIDYITFECAGVEQQAGTETHCVATGEACLERDRIVACPNGEVATGINGRSGEFLDAIGLMCGPAPRRVILGTAKPPTGGQAPAPNLLKGDGKIATLPGGIVQPPAGQPANPPQPQSYALACLGGGNMEARATPDGVVRITFAPASQGSTTTPPHRGECAWSDRGFRPGEPQMLVYNGAGGQNLANAAKRGAVFKVHAYNNNQGAMIVTSIDRIGGKF